jgi:hypothetical protein
MKPSNKKRFRKLTFILVLVFLALFLFRLAYGYTKVIEAAPSAILENFVQTEFEERKNYASKKYRVIAGQTPLRIDQKYEKIAEISSNASSFEPAELQIRKQIDDHDGLIQFENKSGNKGGRRMNLVIGVPPENFDAIYNELTKIGKVQSKQITKKDKTNEYKELNAKKSSLQNIRGSLVELKSKGGKIEEYMQLENRILEIDSQLQELGVSLGNFDDENEFCTVKFSLIEVHDLKIGLMQRIKVALEWTVKTYLKIMAIGFFLSLFAYLTILGIDKLQRIQQTNKGIDQ